MLKELLLEPTSIYLNVIHEYVGSTFYERQDEASVLKLTFRMLIISSWDY